MCDTMVALPSATAAGTLIFAKNSDREANEAQHIVHVPRQRHEAGTDVRCTYIAIPQVAETHAVLLSKPHWMWGAEMGANEHGLIIGNEAVHARIPPQKEPSLIGMDLLRLALERAVTAGEALEVLTALLARHGQGGNCAHTGRFEYHNSFLIADAGGNGWVLETVGREWAAQRVKPEEGGVRTISNTYTIGQSIDRSSAGLVPLAIERGLARDGEGFDFAGAYTNRTRSRFASGAARWCRSSDLLGYGRRLISVEMMFDALRDHGAQAARDRHWRPDGVMGGAICAHASWGPQRRFGQTTASWVAELGNGKAVHWLTASSAPDTSLFKPVLFGPGEKTVLPDFGPAPGDQYDPETLWWRHERLHRAVLEDYARRLALFRDERDRLERAFLARVEGPLRTPGNADKAGEMIAEMWGEARLAEDRWYARVRHNPVMTNRMNQTSNLYKTHWLRLNRIARMGK
ncbi:MAG: C69 family dipeptidase [Parvibaculaceae bacterium]|nr:C69 family dipeptidase [Parvibaculaceae bacterium]